MNLQTGSKGQDVINLQNQLKAAGYDTGASDGIFGAKTQAAVKAYQTANNLAVDGIAGKNTLGSLSNPVAKPTATPTPTKTPTVTAPTPVATPKYEPPTFKPFESTIARPTAPNLPSAPQIGAFNPNIDQSALQQQSLDLLKPQYERGQEQLKDLYGMNMQGINDESLKRGLARGSYVGNRQDRETTESGKREVDLDRNYNEQANLMASQNYDKEYNRQYQGYRDNTENTWRQYQANTDSMWRNYDSLMDLYNLDLTTEQNNYTNQYNDAWKQYDANYNQGRDAITDKQNADNFALQQSQFDFTKTTDQRDYDWNTYMDTENLKLSKANASNKNAANALKDIDPYTMAFNDIFSSPNPGNTWAAKKNQYKEILSSTPGAYEALSAEYLAWLKKNPSKPRDASRTEAMKAYYS